MCSSQPSLKKPQSNGFCDNLANETSSATINSGENEMSWGDLQASITYSTCSIKNQNQNSKFKKIKNKKSEKKI